MANHTDMPLVGCLMAGLLPDRPRAEDSCEQTFIPVRTAGERVSTGGASRMSLSTLIVSLVEVVGVSEEDTGAGSAVYCCLRLKQPHRFLFLRSDAVVLSSGAGALHSELTFHEVVGSPAEGFLVVDVYAIDEGMQAPAASTKGGALIGKIRLPLAELPSVPQSFPLLSGELTLGCQLVPSAPTPEEPTGTTVRSPPPDAAAVKPPPPAAAVGLKTPLAPTAASATA